MSLSLAAELRVGAIQNLVAQLARAREDAAFASLAGAMPNGDR